jgi:hypothetical protein
MGKICYTAKMSNFDFICILTTKLNKVSDQPPKTEHSTRPGWLASLLLAGPPAWSRYIGAA